MKHVDIVSAEAFAVAIPIKMTRREKLLRWAKLVRENGDYFGGYLALYSGLEYWPRRLLDSTFPVAGEPTAFAIAMTDGILREQGLPKTPSILGIMQFFELTQRQLHEFSCDCGGHLTKDEIADRIISLA